MLSGQLAGRLRWRVMDLLSAKKQVFRLATLGQDDNSDIFPLQFDGRNESMIWCGAGTRRARRRRYLPQSSSRSAVAGITV